MTARLLVGLLSALFCTFFAAFGWFCLIQEWRTALVCLLFASIAAVVAFVVAAGDPEGVS